MGTVRIVPKGSGAVGIPRGLDRIFFFKHIFKPLRAVIADRPGVFWVEDSSLLLLFIVNIWHNYLISLI
jgi:hypothetical protein